MLIAFSPTGYHIGSQGNMKTVIVIGGTNNYTPGQVLPATQATGSDKMGETKQYRPAPQTPKLTA